MEAFLIQAAVARKRIESQKADSDSLGNDHVEYSNDLSKTLFVRSSSHRDAAAAFSTARKLHDYLNTLSADRIANAPLELDPASAFSRLPVGARGHLTRHTLRMLKTVLPHFPAPSSDNTVVFRLQWDFDAYIDNQLSGCFDDLDDTITLTAELSNDDDFHTVAMPCAAYVKRQWPAHGQFVLDALKRAYRDRKIANFTADGHQRQHPIPYAGHVETEGSLSLRIFYRINAGLAVATTGTFKDVFDVFNQLCWLCAVCRDDVGAGPVAFSPVWPRYWRRATDPDILIAPGNLAPLSSSNCDACWYSLFSNMAVAHGFPAPARPEKNANTTRTSDELTWGRVGMGLELPFELMTLLAGARYPLDFDGGIVLRGDSTLLVPTGAYGCVIQWHLYESADHGVFGTDEVMERLQNTEWFKTTELSRLTTARTFLAYAAHVRVNLGTPDSGFESVRRSRASVEPTSLQLTSVSSTIGSEGLGFFGGNLGGSFKLTKGLRANIRTSLFSDGDRLHRSSLQPLLLFDDSTSRAWLVPELSVVLHCLHSWAASRELLYKVPFAVPSWDGGKSALRAILDHAQEIVETQHNGTGVSLMDKVNLFLDMFQQRKETGVIRSQDSGPRLCQKNIALLGWEYKDVVEMKSFPQRKHIKLSSTLLSSKNAWPKLIKDSEALVMVCSGLGQPIMPENKAGCCQACLTVPSDANLLTASMKCLQQLDFQDGYIDGMKWSDNSDHHPFATCEQHRVGLGSRIQILNAKSGRHRAPWWINEFPEGAVIFSSSRALKTRPCADAPSRPPVEQREDSAAPAKPPDPIEHVQKSIQIRRTSTPRSPDKPQRESTAVHDSPGQAIIANGTCYDAVTFSDGPSMYANGYGPDHDPASSPKSSVPSLRTASLAFTDPSPQDYAPSPPALGASTLSVGLRRDSYGSLLDGSGEPETVERTRHLVQQP